MNEYETEEQQVAAVKAWLKENLFSIVAGLGLGIAGLGGWNYYVQNQQFHAVQASDLYMQIAQTIERKGIDETVIDLNSTMVSNFSDTPYASLSALSIASKEYSKGNVDETVAQYQWIIKHTGTDELKQIAIMRLTRVLIEKKQFDEAMSYISMQHPVTYDSSYEELKGDLYFAKDDLIQARSAYDKAIQLSPKASKWLLLKRQNLGNSLDETPS